ncbi:hypothetical protein MTO96_013061 [Rhipicephalus appendiculatus]
MVVCFLGTGLMVAQDWEETKGDVDDGTGKNDLRSGRCALGHWSVGHGVSYLSGCDESSMRTRFERTVAPRRRKNGGPVGRRRRGRRNSCAIVVGPRPMCRNFRCCAVSRFVRLPRGDKC